MTRKTIRSLKLIIITQFLFAHALAQDTLRLSLQQADSIFLARNFYLLASAMNIEAQKAQIIQARLYPNPIFSAELNAYDVEHKQALHIGPSGQKVFQVSQLILLGGKRKSQIEMAKTNTAIAELEFQQLVRQLKFRLHSDLFATGQHLILLRSYNNQLALLDALLNTYQTQADKGNVPLKDLVRLKGAYLKLNNDKVELLRQFHDAEANLQTLLQTSSLVEFRFSDQEIESYIKLNPLDEVKIETLENRPELLIMRQNRLLAEQYIHYQKQLAIPDVNLFSAYDQRGGAFPNQVTAGIAIPLPLWNRNQGMIKATQYRLRETDYNMKALETEILSSLQNAYASYLQTVLEYRKTTTLYNRDFEITVRGMTENFQKQNVSIIEFIDFFEAYNDVLTDLTRVKSHLVTSGEHLNLLIGKDIY